MLADTVGEEGTFVTIFLGSFAKVFLGWCVKIFLRRLREIRKKDPLKRLKNDFSRGNIA